jgi:serine/threonine-protein kinase
MPDPTAPGDAIPDPLVGTVVADRYHVERKLGEGGMGAVYLARHIVLEKQVALKILHGEFSHRPDLVERFLHEAKAAARIRHEHVIDISDFGQTSTGNPFFCMELLSGSDLANELKKSGALAWPRAKSIMLQACSALQAAHDVGIVHRDLKPENMFLIERLGHPDFVKVLDFGIAKLTELEESGRRLTRTGMVFGTPEYMSPEQARGDKTDHRVDVYAMGCILYQLVTGDVPFRAETFMGVLTHHLFEEIPAFATRTNRTDLPPGLEAVTMRALEKDKDKRYGSMNELAIAIDQLDVVPGVAYYPPGASRPATATGQVAALQTPVPRTPPGGVPHPVPASASSPTRLEAPALANPTAATVMPQTPSPLPQAQAGGTAAPFAVAAGTPVPAVRGGDGPTMAELAGQRFTDPPAARKKSPVLWIVLGIAVVGGGVGAAIALGGHGKSGGAEQGGMVPPPPKGPTLQDQGVIDAGAIVEAQKPPDAAPTVAALPDAGAGAKKSHHHPDAGQMSAPPCSKDCDPADRDGHGCCKTKEIKDPFKDPPP